MSKIKFTKTQIEQLSKNKYVLKISEKAITYSNEFKIHFIAEYEKGKSSEIEFVKAEVELLKKLELQERQVIKGKIAVLKIFKLIESIVQKLTGHNIIKYLCSLAGISRSGYYRYLNSKDIQERFSFNKDDSSEYIWN